MWMLREHRQRSIGILLAVAVLLATVGVVLPRLVAGAAEQWPSGPPPGTQLCDGGVDSALLNGPSAAPTAYSESTTYTYSATAPIFVVDSGNLYELLATVASGSSNAPSGTTANNAYWQYVNSAANGVMSVPAGNDNGILQQPGFFGATNEVFWFAPGTHTLGTSPGQQLQVYGGDTFLGAPESVLSGGGTNQFALTGENSSATGVVVEYMTIENFNPGNDALAVNSNSDADWTIQYNTIADNTGGGVSDASGNIVNENCLEDNAQYGFQSEGLSSDITLTNNDIEGNDTLGPTNYDQSSYVVSYTVTSDVATITTKAAMYLPIGSQVDVGAAGQCNFGWCHDLSDTALDGTWTVTADSGPPGGECDAAGNFLCTSFTFTVPTGNAGTTADVAGTVSVYNVSEGAAGGGKFWDTSGAVVTGNYIHGNGDTGIWLDTDNTGFDISDNYISDNWANAILYEISYNGEIEDNTFLDNNWGSGPSPGLGGFPDGAIYVNGSGGDTGVALPANGFGYQGTSLLIEYNGFYDNWSGVVLYENADRWCSASSDNYCTLNTSQHLHDGLVRPERPGQRDRGDRQRLRVGMPVEDAVRHGEGQRVRLHARRTSALSACPAPTTAGTTGSSGRGG